ncbi:MFS transporter [Sulfurovum sp. zt1-1]|uniref:MFS transporter n=1 Tax=Sulfurovum zhangzhouensis TaxID=3019067 RepID=A0ABT7QWY5_9BACT|nr:MFS transporter [Sulfurovum zhangzhouensis]MDM5271059.1 MFS transporter [Sulfurovum zhangzhouensis]
MTDYIQTLKHPVVRRLSIIQFLSYFGTWFSQVAIFSMLVGYGADEITIALTAAMSMLPAVVLAPIIGIIVDKVDFKRLMMTLLFVEITMTLGFILIDSLSYVWILMLLIFIRSAAASMLFSAEMTLFPKILQGKMLQRTNEIHSVIWSICYASGMAIGGIATHYMGYDAAFIFDALLYGLAVLLLLGLTLDLEKEEHTDSNWKMFKNGFIYLKNSPKLLHLILLHASIGLTSFDALVTLLADFKYKEIIAVALAIGWLNATRAIALLLGSVLFSKIISQNNLQYFLIAQGVAIITWSQLQANFYISLIAIFIVGLFTTTIWAYTYLMIQENTDKAYLGRVISYNDMFFMVSNVLTAMFIGYAAKWGMSLESITSVLGIGFIFAALYYLWLKKHFIYH